MFVGFVENVPICVCGVLHQIGTANIKRAHRIVVLPEWQGIGVGMKFIEAVAHMIKAEKCRFHITTSTPQLVPAMHKHKTKWKCSFNGRQPAHGGCMKGGGSRNRLTATFCYIGD